MIARKICSSIDGNSLHHWTFHSKKVVLKSSFFYDNRDLKISKSKKSEEYFRDKIEILIAILKVSDARRDVILAGGPKKKKATVELDKRLIIKF